MTRPILVTGCPRSGTAHVAALLERVGVPCGHARQFNPARLELGVPPWPESCEAESSWYAAPYAETLPAGTVVVHLVRHPAAALSSLWRARIFRSRSEDRAYIERHAPQLVHGLPMQQTARLWSAWNELAELARDVGGLRYVRVRLESLDEAALRWISELSERAIEPEAARRALAELARAAARPASVQRDDLAEWTGLRGSDVLSAIDELAARYGYGRGALGQLLASAA